MKTLVLIICLLSLSGTVRLVDGARILGLFTIPSISHQVVYQSLMKELHSRGHELFVFTPNPIRDPNLTNYTEIDLSVSYGVWSKRFEKLTQTRDNGVSVPSMLIDFVQAGLDLCEVELNLPEVKKFIEENESKFDIVIAEWILSPCFAIIPYKLRSPLIGISSLPPGLGVHAILGNPAHPSYSPDFLLGYTDHPSFLEKIHSTVHIILFQLVYNLWLLPAHDAVVRRIFSDTDMPFIEDVINNVSLILVNSHFSFYYPRPNVPNMVEIAGLHLTEPKTLPQDLQQYLDGAPEGVIYFSLGTNVRSDSMSESKRQMFLDAFSELSQFRVLWKWESDVLPGLPSNVKLAKWLPQQDILAHPKVKTFIYQGGLQSTEEAVREQVPVIGIPFFADQDLNVRKMVEAGAGIKLDFQSISKENILNALKKTIYEPSFKENIRKLSEITKDQPETPMERAVWWTEYVIRHKGARHLRSAALDLTWYQYLLLDVIAFITLTSAITIYLAYLAIKLLRSLRSFMSRAKLVS